MTYDWHSDPRLFGLRDFEEKRPCCECGFCHGPNFPLPMVAWQVAGQGDPMRLAVRADHARHFDPTHHTIERHRGWAAVGSASEPS